MITVIVHHWVLPEKLDLAKGLIQQAGKTMRSFPGFVLRHTLIAQTNPLQLSTVTCWETEEAFQAFARERDKPREAPGEPMWTREPEITVFTAMQELP
jgi:heme-degrading monooxygenase HmoA